MMEKQLGPVKHKDYRQGPTVYKRGRSDHPDIAIEIAKRQKYITDAEVFGIEVFRLQGEVDELVEAVSSGEQSEAILHKKLDDLEKLCLGIQHRISLIYDESGLTELLWCFKDTLMHYEDPLQFAIEKFGRRIVIEFEDDIDGRGISELSQEDQSLELARRILLYFMRGKVHLPIEFMVWFLTIHDERMSKLRESNAQDIPSVINFLVEHAIKIKYMSDERIRDKLSKCRVMIGSTLALTTDFVTGLYAIGNNTIYLIEIPTIGSYIWDILHEVFHVLAGKSHMLVYEGKGAKDGSAVEKCTDVIVLKCGMKFIGFPNRWGKYLRWIDEALTENLVHIDTQNGSYLNERKLLRHLFKLGLDLDMAYKAYFEDWGENSTGHSLPHTRDFFRHTNKVFGKAFLYRISRYIFGDEDDAESAEENMKKLINCSTIDEINDLIDNAYSTPSGSV